MLRIAGTRNGARRADREQSCRRSAADRAESAQALFGRHRDQPRGVAKAGKDVSRGLARSRQARRHRGDGFWRFTEPVAAEGAADLARAAQRRDDRGPAAPSARLAAKTVVHLGGAASSHLADALADQPDGRGHRDLRHLGVVPQARGCRRDAWRRYRLLCATGRSRRGVCGSKIARALRHRLLRPRACAKGQRRLC